MLTDNATAAISCVLDAVLDTPGGSVVVTDHGYAHVNAAAATVAAGRGMTCRTATLPADGSGVAAAVLDQVDGTTRLVIVDQITSASTRRLPVRAIVDALDGQVPVLVDGAHSPGLLAAPAAVDADFWVGNFHKWAYSPRTVAALVATPRWHDRLRPAHVSDGYHGTFTGRFTVQGTRDISARLALPTALTFPTDHLGCSWDRLRMRLVDRTNRLVDRAAALTGTSATPPSGLPMRLVATGLRGGPRQAAQLMEAFLRQQVEVAVTSLAGELWVRVSGQTYTPVEDADRLAAAWTPAVQQAGSPGRRRRTR